MATILKFMTAEELLLLPDDGMQRELIRGVLTEDMPPGYQHGLVESRIARLLANFAEDNDFGRFSPAILALCWSATLTQCEDRMSRGYRRAVLRIGPLATPSLQPDLVVEVKSPSNSNREMADRALMWLSHGTRMALVADSLSATLTLYRPEQPPMVLSDGDEFDGGDVPARIHRPRLELLPPPRVMALSVICR